MVLDMTTGSPIKKVMRFFVPVLLGNLLQQFYSMADSFIVSRYLGVEAFAGISATGALNFLILGFTWGMCAGCSIPVSQEFGAGDYAKMRRCFANGIYLEGVVAVLIGIIMTIFTPQILKLIGTPEDIFDYSCTYIRIIFAGIPATVMYNLLAGVMRAVGDGRTPLYMLILSCLLNIVLDLLFVVTFNMGIAGAAIATLLAQFVSGLLCLYVIFGKMDILKVRSWEWKIDTSILKRLASIGLPMGLQFSITAVGSTILQRAVNSLGSQAVAAIGAGGKVQFVFTTPLEAVGATMATYCGQNLGARRIDRVRDGVRKVTLISAAYCIVAYGVQMLVGEPLARLFIGAGETQLLEWTVYYIRFVTAFSMLLGIVLIYRNAIQGLGYSSVAMLAGIMELVGRVTVAFVLVANYGFKGACFSNPVAWLSADILLVPVYFIVVKKLQRRMSA